MSGVFSFFFLSFLFFFFSFCFFFFFTQKTAYEFPLSLVGSEMCIRARHRLAEVSPAPGRPSAWCALLEAPGVSPEAVALALAAGIGPRRPLLHWWARWRHVPAPLSAAELMAREGLKPGPGLGERLRQLRAERLDGDQQRLASSSSTSSFTS